jgi:hypothetical protein
MSLDDQTLPDLKRLAKIAEIEGYSTMKKDDLLEAFAERGIGQPLGAAALSDTPPDINTRMDSAEDRLNALEARVSGLDARTLPATKLMRDTYS